MRFSLTHPTRNLKLVREFLRGPARAHYNGEIEMKVHHTTLQDVIQYLCDALSGFECDPANDDFQLGYEQALKDMMTDLIGRPAVRWLH